MNFLCLLTVYWDLMPVRRLFLVKISPVFVSTRKKYGALSSPTTTYSIASC